MHVSNIAAMSGHNAQNDFSQSGAKLFLTYFLFIGIQYKSTELFMCGNEHLKMVSKFTSKELCVSKDQQSAAIGSYHK